MGGKLSPQARELLAKIIEFDGRFGRASAPIAELRRAGLIEDAGGTPAPLWKATPAGRAALSKETER